VAELKPGAVTIDFATSGIYGDLDHCPTEDLLESARALLELTNGKRGKAWGVRKDYDKGWSLANEKGGRERWCRFDTEPLVGSIREGQMTDNVEGIPVLNAEARGGYLRRLETYQEGQITANARQERKEKLKGKQVPMF